MLEVIYSHEQEDAISLCCDLSKRIVAITGEAGTGKTTILKGAFERIICDDPVLAAPTGRAAKRIQEATGIHARTIHRMMRYTAPDPDDKDDASLPAHHKHNPMPYDAIFIDEASMVDRELYRNIIDAMQAGSVIRFFGDVNQLPPVLGDSPFKDVLHKFPSQRLTQNFRSDDGLIQSAHSIIKGTAPVANDKFEIVRPGSQNVFEEINIRIDDSYRGMRKQVITPTNKGKYGVLSLNAYMQQKLNPKGAAFELPRKEATDDDLPVRVRRGDKVIWTQNDYNLKLFNGMIGWVVDFDYDSGELVISFDGEDKVIPPVCEKYDPVSERVKYTYDPRTSLDLAYAITTHKSQGSEFDEVMYVMFKSFVLSRENFYTAITRAKHKATVVVGTGALHRALKPAQPDAKRK